MVATNTSKPEKRGDTDRLNVLYEVNDILTQITAGSDMEKILPHVLRTAVRALDGLSGSIFVFDDLFNLKHTWIVEGNKATEEEANSPISQMMRDGVAGTVVQTGEPLIIENTIIDKRWNHLPDHQTTLFPWSVMCIPLRSPSRVIGTLTVARPGQAQFGEQDVSLLTAVATQAANTIANAILYQDSRERAEKLSALVNATAAINSSLELNQVLSILTEQTTALLDAPACLFLNYDAQTQKISGHTLYTRRQGIQDLNNTTSESLSTSRLLKDILNYPRPVQFKIHELDAEQSEHKLLSTMRMSAMLIMPVTTPTKQPAGLVVLLDRNPARTFTDEEISLANAIASQASIALQNAHLHAETERQLRLTTLLNETSTIINSTLNLEEIMQKLLEKMNEFLRAEAISIALADLETRELVIHTSVGVGSDKIKGLRLPARHGISGWVLENCSPAMVNDTRSDPRFYRVGDERTGHTTNAIICAPLQVHGNAIGTIQAINPTAREEFVENDLNLLVNLANLASSAMANAQQFALTQAARARFVGLFQDSIDPILLTNTQGQIVDANQRALEFFEYDKDELLEMRVNDLHTVETGFLGEKQFEPIRMHQVKIFNCEIITKDKSRVMAEAYTKRIMADDSELLQWIYHDISQQIELENLRDDLIAMLFHDLQSPLGNIISSLSLVLEDLMAEVVTPVSVEMVDVAIKSGERLQRLVKSLLDINRLEAGSEISNKKQVNILQLLDDAQDVIQTTLERRQITFEREIDLFLPALVIDEDMIRRVLINLLDNAIKYSQDGQHIILSVTQTNEPRSVIFSLSDQGPGIPPKYRDQIFDKFRQLEDKQTRTGFGLGLAFCRLAIEAHDGRIWVDAAEGGGARFNFSLPVA